MRGLFLFAAVWVAGWTSLGSALGSARGSDVDYADPTQVDAWLRHPVYGDPSFDSFEHAESPVFRGAAPLEWPVNGFLFHDPVSGHLYVYVGDYTRGYWGRPSRCVLFRSTDGGKNWANLGTVLPEDPTAFDGDGKSAGHLPDVSVVRFDGRYHMVYDWGRADTSDGGVAYAWADKPEGPFHRDREPILRHSSHLNLLGRYSRPYAATLVRRNADWLVLGMFDDAPRGWAMWAISSPTPHGPWSKPVLVRNVEGSYFHPPLLEFFPAFSHDGFVYAPATSVALNRDFQCLFRAPLERATDPAAWEIVRHGSLWHSDDRENEFHGIWGQTFSGFVEDGRNFRVMFPSRDPHDLGTINLATRPWDRPFGTHGFILGAHDGRSFTRLRAGYEDFQLHVTARVRGTARLLWDSRQPLGPDRPASDATLHPLMLTRHRGVELSAAGWRVLKVDDAGRVKVMGQRGEANQTRWAIDLSRRGRYVTLRLNEKAVWQADDDPEAGPGGLGWLLEPNTWLKVEEFRVTGEPTPGTRRVLFTEGFLDAAEDPARWEEVASDNFEYGRGAVSRSPDARAKWSVVGRQLRLLSPKGPDWSSAEIRVDDTPPVTVDLHDNASKKSTVVWSSAVLEADFHCVRVHPLGGRIPLDCLEVSDR